MSPRDSRHRGDVFDARCRINRAPSLGRLRDVGSMAMGRGVMLIGTSGRFETHFSPDECAERLRQNLRRFSISSHADRTRFRLAKRGRTMIRIVGAVEARDGGSTVNYKIEFMPAALVALGISAVASIPIFVAWSFLGYPVVPILLLLLVAIVLAGTLNFWISERQARWLRDYVTTALDAEPSLLDGHAG